MEQLYKDTVKILMCMFNNPTFAEFFLHNVQYVWHVYVAYKASSKPIPNLWPLWFNWRHSSKLTLDVWHHLWLKFQKILAHLTLIIDFGAQRNIFVQLVLTDDHEKLTNLNLFYQIIFGKLSLQINVYHLEWW